MLKSLVSRAALPAFGLCALVVMIASSALAQLDPAEQRLGKIQQEGIDAAAAQSNRIAIETAAIGRDNAEQAARAQALQDQIQADYQRARAAEIIRNAHWQTKPTKSQEAWKAKNQSEWEQRDRDAAARQ